MAPQRPPAVVPEALSTLENDELFRRLRRSAEPDVRAVLVDRFMPLTRKLAGRYMNPYEPYEDLVQVASIGLLAAIDRFDPDRGVRFPSFAIPTILGELKRYFRSTGWSAHVPRGPQELAIRVDRAARDIQGRTGRTPNVSQLEEELSLPTEDVLLGLEASTAHYAVSLDAPLGGDSESDPEPLSNVIGETDERLGLVETQVAVGTAMQRLPQAEREALRLRLNEDLKQTEIAERMGCSQMQVSRLLRHASERLRELTGRPALGE